ncbi:MAG: hypothetical protein E4G92_02995 [Bacteroidia bacterium]|nr:MAG: hypothetical protein E4G92_02995 [Bacteroidia bacterium]
MKQSLRFTLYVHLFIGVILSGAVSGQSLDIPPEPVLSNDQRAGFYFNADTGYLLNFNGLEVLSAFFLNPSVGLHMVEKDRLAVNFSGIMHQSGGPHGQSSFVSFKLGLEFKGRAMNKFMIIK